MGRSCDMILPGAPLLPGVWRCGCGFLDDAADDPGRCRRPDDRVLRAVLGDLPPPDTSRCTRPDFSQYSAGYFRPFPIGPIWDAMEAAGVDQPRIVDYGHTVTAALALTIGTRLGEWLRARRALLVSPDHVAAEVDRHRADLCDDDDSVRLARAVRDDRDEAFDGLRWFAHFARYNRVAADFGGYTVG